jgi:hypothetical protein
LNRKDAGRAPLQHSRFRASRSERGFRWFAVSIRVFRGPTGANSAAACDGCHLTQLCDAGPPSQAVVGRPRKVVAAGDQAIAIGLPFPDCRIPC